MDSKIYNQEEENLRKIYDLINQSDFSSNKENSEYINFNFNFNFSQQKSHSNLIIPLKCVNKYKSKAKNFIFKSSYKSRKNSH